MNIVGHIWRQKQASPPPSLEDMCGKASHH